MGRLFLISLEEECYSCKYCRTELAPALQYLSPNYGIHGGRAYGERAYGGRAYLFHKAVNVTEGEETRYAMTGLCCTLAKVFCVQCGSTVGFKYVAGEPPNSYEGFFLERYKIFAPDGSCFFEAVEYVEPQAGEYVVPQAPR